METFRVIAVTTLPQYKLLVTFNNNERRLFDMSSYLTDPFFAPLKNLHVFQSARINPITVEWNGEIDICPDELYYNSTPYQQ